MYRILSSIAFRNMATERRDVCYPDFIISNNLQESPKWKMAGKGMKVSQWLPCVISFRRSADTIFEFSKTMHFSVLWGMQTYSAKKYNYCCLECPNTSCTASFLVLMSLSSISFPMLCNVMGIIWSVPKKSSIPFQPKSVQPLGHSRMLYFSSHQQLPKGSRTAYKSDEILGVFSPQWSVLVKRFQKVLDRTWRYVK